MSPEQRRYFFVESAIGAALVNALINGALGWAATIGLSQFPMWKVPGVGGDLLATAFGVSFGTCFGVRLQAKIDLKRGKITAPDLRALAPFHAALVSRLPAGLFARAVVAGLVSVPLFAPPVLVALASTGLSALDRNVFIAVKTVFSAVEGGLVTPILLLGALIEPRSVARDP